MRTVVLALVLGLVGAGTASASSSAPRHKAQARTAAKKHHRAMKHAKAKTRHSGAKHAESDGLMKPSFV
jgi:hypothetical protein